MARRRAHAGFSRHPDPVVAAAEASATVLDAIGSGPVLSMVFVATQLTAGRSGVDRFVEIVRIVEEVLDPDVVVGSDSVGVIGGGEEAESGPAVAVWAWQGPASPAADTPQVAPVRCESIPGVEPLIVVGSSGARDPASLGSDDALVLLADPATADVDSLLAEVGDAVVVGGCVLRGGGPPRMAVGRRGAVRFHDDGAVGVALTGGLVEVVVSQGCRPIGEPWTVTGVEGRLLRSLGGRPALDRVDEMVPGLSDRDRLRAAQGLFVGVAVRESVDEPTAAEFVVRPVLGAQRSSRSVAVEPEVPLGATVQFHIRDAEAAHDDLVSRVGAVSPADGALLFTSAARGSNLFAEDAHDAGTVGEVAPVDAGSVAGMFCDGELGPSSGRNLRHDQAAVVAFFAERR